MGLKCKILLTCGVLITEKSNVHSENNLLSDLLLNELLKPLYFRVMTLLRLLLTLHYFRPYHPVLKLIQRDKHLNILRIIRTPELIPVMKAIMFNYFLLKYLVDEYHKL